MELIRSWTCSGNVAARAVNGKCEEGGGAAAVFLLNRQDVCGFLWINTVLRFLGFTEQVHVQKLFSRRYVEFLAMCSRRHIAVRDARAYGNFHFVHERRSRYLNALRSPSECKCK